MKMSAKKIPLVLGIASYCGAAVPTACSRSQHFMTVPTFSW